MAMMRRCSSCWDLGGRWLGVLAGGLVIGANALSAQMLMPGGMFRLFTSDAAILESQEVRKDLPCNVLPAKPSLGFDLKFHSGYSVSVPLRELSGDGNLLTMIFRVTPEAHPDEPVYLSQRMSVPNIADDVRGDAALQGGFDVGMGKYHVDWLMRDRSEHVCSSNWDIEATLPPKDREMALNIGPSVVEPPEAEPFREEPAIPRVRESTPLNVKVMVNFAPQNAYSAALQPIDMSALISILRNIAREPRIGRFSLVAFNMQEQRVIYRQQSSSQINFPALGEALHTLNLGTVDFRRLGQKHSDSEFLTNLITTEIKDDNEPPDAVIIAGPKVMLDDSIPQEPLKQIGDLHFPLFYMNYNLNPQATPWRDAIGTAVKYLKGAEYTITRPRDLFFVWSEIMGRIVKSKIGTTASTSPSP
jgi:hypothetical protein